MKELHSALKFIVAGGLAATSEFLSFILLVYMSTGVLLSNTISFSCGLVVSFTLNKLWVFGVKGGGKSQLTKYLVLALINLLISNLLIGLLVYNLNVRESISKVIVMATVAIWNYLIFSRYIFNPLRGDLHDKDK